MKRELGTLTWSKELRMARPSPGEAAGTGESRAVVPAVPEAGPAPGAQSREAGGDLPLGTIDGKGHRKKVSLASCRTEGYLSLSVPLQVYLTHHHKTIFPKLHLALSEEGPQATVAMCV